MHVTIQKLQNLISKRILWQGVRDTAESAFLIAVSSVLEQILVTTACVPNKANYQKYSKCNKYGLV